MQDLLAILIAVAAAAYLARRIWQRLAHRRAACDSCSSCSSLKSQPLVSISPIMSHAKPQRREEVEA
jgi:hypothetical protein